MPMRLRALAVLVVCVLVVCVLVVCVLAAGAAAAAEPPSTNPPYGGGVPDEAEGDRPDTVLEPPVYVTVVTATRDAASEFTTPRSVRVVERETFEERMAVDPVDAIADVPGVALQRTNRGAGTPLIRGLVGPQNLLLVDGVRYSLATFRTGPNQYAGLMDPLALDRVEVLLGPGSTLWGTDAMGGIVHMRSAAVPTMADRSWTARVLARFDAADLGFTAGGLVGGRSDDGDFGGWIGGSIGLHQELRTGGTSDTLPRSDYTRGSWRMKGRAELGAGWSLTLAYFGTILPDAVRTDTLVRGDFREYSNQDDLAYLRAEYDGRDGVVEQASVTLSWRHVDDQVDRTNCKTTEAGGVADGLKCLQRQPSQVTRVRRNTDTVHGLGLSASTGLGLLDGRLRLRLGAEGHVQFVSSEAESARAEDDFATELLDRGTLSDGSLWASADAWLLAEGAVVRQPGVLDFVLTAGARVSHQEAHAPDVPGLGDVGYGATGVALSASARVSVLDRFVAYASWDQGFRAPNLQEATALGDTGTFFEVPNDGLGPERSDQVELGFRLMGRYMSLRGAFFHTWLSDALVREAATFEGQDVVDGKEVRRRVNAESATYLGAEMGIAVTPHEGVTVFADVAGVEGTVVRVDGTREPGRRVPPVQGTAGVRWQMPWKRGWLQLRTRWAMAQRRLGSTDRQDLRICADPNEPWKALGDACDGTNAWVDLELAGGFEPVDGLRVDLALGNLLDLAYRTHGSGFDQAGVTGRLQLRYEY